MPNLGQIIQIIGVLLMGVGIGIALPPLLEIGRDWLIPSIQRFLALLKQYETSPEDQRKLAQAAVETTVTLTPTPPTYVWLNAAEGGAKEATDHY